MASGEKALESTGILSKMDADGDGSECSGDLQPKDADISIIDLDSTGTSELNASNHIVLSDSDAQPVGAIEPTSPSNMGEQSVTDIVETDVDLETKNTMVAPADSSSAAEGQSKQDCTEKPAEPSETEVIVSDKCENVDSTIDELLDELVESASMSVVGRIETDAPERDDEKDETAAENSTAMADADGGQSLKKCDDRALITNDVGVIDDSMKSDENIAQELTDESNAGDSEATVEKEQTIAANAESEVEAMEVDGAQTIPGIDFQILKNADNDVNPKNVDSDIVDIDVLMQSEKISANVADESACVNEAEEENAGVGSVETGETSNADAPTAEISDESVADNEVAVDEDKSESNGEVAATKDAETLATTVQGVTIVESNERAEIDADVSSECERSIAAESGDAEAPTIESTHAGQDDESPKDNNGGVLPLEENHQSGLIDETAETALESREKMYDSDEFIDAGAEKELENSVSMDVDESEVEFETDYEIEKQPQSTEGIVKDPEETDDNKTEPDSTSTPESEPTSPSIIDKDGKIPERAPVIRVKSMAFLCSDTPENSNDATEPTDTDIDEVKATEKPSTTLEDSTRIETMEVDKSPKKAISQETQLLESVLKTVLGTAGLGSGEQTDSDSEAHLPERETDTASEVTDVQTEPAVKTTPIAAPKLRSQPEVKECLNFDCSRKSQEFFVAPEFVISHFHVMNKRKLIYVCDECFDITIAKYGELGGALEDKQPLYLEDIPRRPECVDLLDSSDEEEEENVKENGKSEDGDESTSKAAMSSESLKMIESELENVIASTLERINISEQMEWNRQILNHKFDHQMTASMSILDDLKQLQRTADRIYKDTYRGLNCYVEEISAYDAEKRAAFHISNADYPPVGPFEHEKELDLMNMYYTVRKSLVSMWTPCRIVEKVKYDKFQVGDMYKVQWLRPSKKSGLMSTRMVNRKSLAYGKAPPNRLEIGTRCIALFSTPSTKNTSFYPGIIAEPLREYNKWRYLVFFDDGYTQYVEHEDVRVVCEASENVWEDVVFQSREFIETYLQQFSRMRPMVQVQRGQRMMTEYSGTWVNAIVSAVDASLVQMYFEEQKRFEWIYRGSTRLGPLYRQNKQNAKQKNAPKVVNLVEKVTECAPKEPAVTEQSTPAEAPPIQRTFPAQATRDTPQKQREKREQAEQQEKEKRAVAKKSSSLPARPTVQHLNNSTIYVDEDNKPKGKVVYYTAKRHLPPRKYTTHDCSPSCLFQITHNLSTYSPLSKPLLSGWERQICKSKGKKTVVYKAPCGRRLRNMGELHRYLRMTNCSLNVENFDYDFMIHCLAEYVIDTCILNKPDISEGVESMVVPCVNYYDSTMPPPCVYSAKRIPTEGVNLNLDKEFMCGCDCTDDCLDKSKCQCWQLTIAGAKYGNPYTPAEEIGYEFKRLPEPVPTGIYECNSSCKCKSNCLNRVAQQPLQMKLQVFKTGNRGWGLRCLNDVPKGSFICCYAGNLLTEQVANEAGENLGDEYFAELDYIEVVESLKEGYEPDVVNDDEESSEDEFDPDAETANKDDSDDEFVSKAYVGERRIKTRYRTRNSVDVKKKDEKKKKEERKRDADDSSDDERQPMSFMPSQGAIQDEGATTKSIRKFFGKNEAVYIMDAKKSGNIGRYFNHSCAPNLFVQNVFVDTHDLRFPWVAFFASSHIRAGTELTWNYNYDVGSVPGKVLFCQCGAVNCRGRLL